MKLFLVAAAVLLEVDSLIVPRRRRAGMRRAELEQTEVGTKEYYDGFLSSPVKDETLLDRDPNGGLDQALKLGAGATVVLSVLFLGFMASNGLL